MGGDERGARYKAKVSQTSGAAAGAQTPELLQGLIKIFN
jgi:hypothetical protein